MKNLAASSDVQASRQYKALDHYVSHSHHHHRHHDEEKSNISLPETITAFCSPTEEASTANSGVENELIVTWQALLAHAANLHHHDSSKERGQLAELVLAVQARTFAPKSGRAEEAEVEGMRLWADLPILGREVREMWNSAPDSNSSRELSDRWRNLNAFVATLLARAHETTHDQPDFSLFGLWTIRSALESSSSSQQQGEDKQDRQQPSSADVGAACTWFIYASATLYAFCSANKDFEGKVARAGPGQEGKEWRGFSIERWEVWKQQLQRLKTGVDDDEVRRLVKIAREHMVEADKAST